MSKIRLSEPAIVQPAPSNKNTLVIVTVAGLVLTCASLLVVVGVLAFFVINGGGDSNVDSGKVSSVASAATKMYVQNMARVDEHMAQQVLDKKVKNKSALSSQANSKAAAARMAAYEELNKLDNATFPDDFAGHEQEVADYLKACAEGRRKAVK